MLRGFDMLGAVSVGADAPSLTKVREGRAVLRQGMRGGAVKYVQGKLGVPADGDFGTNTRKAVEAYQLNNFLRVDGVVGRDTLLKLEGGSAASATAPSPPPLMDPYATGPASSVPQASRADDRPLYGPPAPHPEWLASRARDASSAPPPLPYAAYQWADPAQTAPAQPSSDERVASAPTSVPDVARVLDQIPLAIRPGHAQQPSYLPEEDEESWFVRDTLISSVPNAGVLAGGAALGVGVFYLLKRVFSRAVGI